MGASGRQDDDHLEFLNQQFSVGVIPISKSAARMLPWRLLETARALPKKIRNMEELSELSWPLRATDWKSPKCRVTSATYLAGVLLTKFAT
jgi:hypothetical protein